MKVKKITVNNLKAISALTADFNGCTAIITGGNNKGKSSFLRSLPERLQGKKPKIIVKQNETEGFAEWELTDGSKFIWKFDTKTKKGESLTFVTKDGIKAAVTRGIAQRYFASSFDIDEFLIATPQKQIQILQRLVGLDFTELDAQYKHAYEDRTRLNTIANNERTKCVPIQNELPDATVDITALQAKIIDGNKHNQKVRQYEQNKTTLEKNLANEKKKLKEIQNTIAFIEGDITNYSNWLAENQLLDVVVFDKQTKEAIELNEKIQANNAAKRQLQIVVSAENKAKAADKRVQVIVKQKQEKIQNAPVPDGFEFTETAILYNDLPLSKEQQSSSNLYIAALKLASMNLGEVKTLYFDASTLDKNSLAEIETWANDNDLQLLIERPDFDGEDIQYIIRKAETSPA